MTSNPIQPALQFPSSNTSRTWLLTSGASALGLILSRALLDHGDNVVLGVMPGEYPSDDSQSSHTDGTRDGGTSSSTAAATAPAGGGLFDTSDSPRGNDVRLFLDYVVAQGWRERVVVVECDGSQISHCQSAIATATSRFGQLDVLLCNHSEAVFGTIEELSACADTQTLSRQQMKTNFFAPVNMIRAAVPVLRGQGGGHIMVVTGITSHLGTPGLPLFCAAAWGLEGFCDSLAYEIAPFNIKMSIIQPSAEIAILPNRILAAPQLPHYLNPDHPAPLARTIFARMLDRLNVTAPPGSDKDKPCLLSQKRTIVDPVLPPNFLSQLLAETVHAICAIGGHENPPARHIVGMEGMAAVKEKLKTMSEELEDFLSVSAAADMEDIASRKTADGRHSSVPVGG